MPPLDFYQNQLETLQTQGLYRHCPVIQESPDLTWPVIKINEKKVIDFCSNNYLGLANHPELIKASIDATQQYGTSSRASRLVSGTLHLTQQLEQAVAAFKHAESALVFNSGYQGNVAVLQAILSKTDTVFFDRLNHGSLIDGVMLSGAKWQRYRHLDLIDLEQKLSQSSVCGQKWIVTDSVFSMDGDYGDLPALCDLAEQYDAHILLDEAHGTGVFGDQKSSGLAEAQQVSNRIALQFGTFSKALGSYGAYVAGPQVLIETIVNKGRGFIYSTALPPGVIAANAAAVHLVQKEQHHKEALWKNIRYFESQIQLAEPQWGSELIHPVQVNSPIIPIVLGETAMAVSQQLLEAGFFVQAIRSPTVAAGSERLRITLSSSHTKGQIDGLIQALIHSLAAV